MHPTSSFLSKCTTVLIGMALSWATVTNPHADQVAQYFFGSGPEAAEDELTDFPPSPAVAPLQLALVEDADHRTKATEVRSEAKPAAANQNQRIEQISGMLRELGATYLRLEKLSKSDGIWYRVRCDLASDAQPVKCCLEATRKSAIAAMEDVLQAARDGIDNSKIAASGQ